VNFIKVCHITTVHSAFDTRIFHKECKTLLNAGYDVSLVVQHARQETIDGIKIIPLKKPKNRLYRMIFLPFKAYKLALKQKADIYHLHDPELIFIGILLKIRRKKVIYDVHEYYKDKILSKSYINNKYFKILISNLFDFIEKVFSKHFNYIITADNYAKCKFKVKNIERIANFPKIINLPNNEKFSKTCIYSGGLSIDRGILKIVEMLSFIEDKDIKIILIGKWENEELKSSINKIKNIVYLGFLPWEDALKITYSCNIGLNLLQPVPAYLYAAENSVKIFEYMIASIPIISSNFKGLKEIIERNNCGICVDPTNPKEIAKAINYLIDHPEEAKKMGQNGRKAVELKYNWEIEAKKLLEVYNILINQ